jgi:alpha/beta superfamily hydrolase
MNNHVLVGLEEAFLNPGYLTLRFNFRGTAGTREGFGGLAGAVEDADAACSLIRSRHNLKYIGLVGYSFGGLAALKLATLCRVDFLVALSASFGLMEACDTACGSYVPSNSLLIHGSLDTVVPYPDLQKIIEMLEAPK